MKPLKLSLVWAFLIAVLIPAAWAPQSVHAEGVDFQGFRFTYIEVGSDTDPTKPADGKASDEPNIEPVLGYRPSGSSNDDPYIVYKYSSQLRINDTPYTVFNETFCFDNLGSVCPGAGEFSEYFVLINSETFDAYECGVRNGDNEEDRLNECSQLIANGTIESGGDEYPIGIPESTIYAQSFSPEAIDENGGVVPTFNDDGSSSGATEDTEESCETSAGAFGWLLCTGLNVIGSALTFVDAQVQELLRVPAEYYEGDGDGNGAPAAWRSFRNIAYFILVIIALVMVISTALGFEFVSAYTIKRALPRFVIATIFIALSFELTKLAVVIVDEVGRGLLGFTASAFGALDSNGNVVSLIDLVGGGNNNGGWATDLIGGTGVAIAVGVAIGGAMTLLGFAGIAFLTVLGVLLLLMFRQIFIIFLMITAPLAILSWIFPGNDKLWGIWKTTFIGLLGLFPIITLMLGVGRGFAYTIDSNVGSDASGGTQILATILMIIAYIAPYFLIPSAFKYAGSAFSSVAGMIDKNGKGLGQRSRQRIDRFTGNKARLEDKAKSQEAAGRKRQTNRYTGQGIASKHLPDRLGRGLGTARRRSMGVNELAALSSEEEQKKQLNAVAAYKTQKQFNDTASKQGRSAALAQAQNRAKALQGSTRATDLAEYSAIVGTLAQQKDVKGVKELQDAAIKEGGQAANNWNTSMSNNYGSIKPVAPHIATEIKTKDGDRDLSQSERQAAVDEQRQSAFAGSTLDGLSTMKADAWADYAEVDPNGALNSYVTVFEQGGEVAANLDPGGLDGMYDKLNGKYDDNGNLRAPSARATQAKSNMSRPSTPGTRQDLHDWVNTPHQPAPQGAKPNRPPRPAL